MAGQGQYSQALSAARAEYEAGDQENALISIQKALEGAWELTEVERGEAFLYKGKILVQLYQIAVSTGDENMAGKYGNVLPEALEAFTEAAGYCDEQRLPEIDDEIQALYYPLLEIGVGLLEYSSSGELNESLRNEYLSLTRIYFESALNIEDGYLPYDLLGQTLLMSGDSLGAASSFGRSVEWYGRQTPEQPDMLTGYASYRKAIIERYFIHDPERAVYTLSDGIALVEKEMKRLETLKSGLPPGKYDEIRLQGIQVKNDLINLKLDIMMNEPDMTEKALQEFENVLKTNPGDYNKIVAYAGLLEKADIEKAIDMYLKATEVDATKELAWFNLGVLYNNKGLQWITLAVESGDGNTAGDYHSQANAALEKAAEYFKKALDCDPDSLESVKALKNICLRLNKTEEWKLYDEIEKRITQ